MRAAFVLAILIGTTSTAWAGSTTPVIVIPGRPGVPIIINGVDASYAVVEGDWGLGKGIHVQPTVYGGHIVDWEPHVGHYYPSAGHQPGYGRLEIEPPANRKLPKPAESYHDSVSAESMSQPQQAQPTVPLYPPPVIAAPPYGGGSIQQDFGSPPPDFRKPKKLQP
ncbi:MAG: hypothetical protein E8A46_22720 [Bradyrhizobium sp.]|jgi:hypothetical protein|uniref:hypothetical protein n=1 Tax=Bradyrhizobium sp. TaxID=376 RepID=UPI0011FD0CC8|nr:hypothetical protein [Bradyrhizobium sp.]THD48103.1 MAG: hypothetical protein E8A46_22720 [Bradyrhizobium sp.]